MTKIFILLLLLLSLLLYNREPFRSRRRRCPKCVINCNDYKIDKRTRKNYTLIENALSTIDRISGYHYRVGGDMGGSYDSMGFKEDEVRQTLPHAIENGVVSNERMIPYLFQANKELSKAIQYQLKWVNEMQQTLNDIQVTKKKLESCMATLGGSKCEN